MVKIRNVFGDRYKGRQGDAVYQGRYGKQIRRTWNDRKKNRSPAQEEQKKRFRQAHAWVKSLSTQEIEGLKRFTAEHYPNLTWQQYAIKTALDRGKVSITVNETSTEKEIWKGDWDAEGWLYRQVITVQNSNSTDLTDFQVKLELNSENVGANFDWSRQGADLRFYDSNGTKLPYYVETWDEVNKRAVIWVKVGSIGANSSASIKMYYGNAEAKSESDAEAVFDFYDDFNDLSKWSLYTGDAGEVQDGWLVITNKSTSVYLADAQVAENAIIETYGYDKILNGDADIQVGIADTGAGKKWTVDINANAWVNLNRSSIGSSSFDWYVQTEMGSQSAPLYGMLQLIKTGSTFKGVFIRNDGARWETPTRTESDYDVSKAQKVMVGVTSGSADTIGYDWVRVRKYAEQEPTATLQSEEYGKIKVEEILVRTTVTVSHSGLKAVEVYDDQGNLLVRADGLSDLRNGEVTQVWEWHINKDQAQPIGRVVYWSISGVKNEWTAGGT